MKEEVLKKQIELDAKKKASDKKVIDEFMSKTAKIIEEVAKKEKAVTKQEKKALVSWQVVNVQYSVCEFVGICVSVFL